MVHIGIVAGEVSGDNLAAGLIAAFRKRHPELDLRVTGIGGPRLAAAGCEILFPMEKLAVMGIAEVLGRYRELRSIQGRLCAWYLDQRPDVFIGVDAPDFNLSLERRLHRAGIRTMHYVSPSIWAWRSYRLRTIAQAVDLVVTLFPFENAWYERYGIPVVCAGHPLAARIPLATDKVAARQRLGLPPDRTVIALMPGSRRGELERHVRPFLEAAAWCSHYRDSLYFVSSLTQEHARSFVTFNAAVLTPGLPLSVYTDRSLDVMEAADVVLLASGTAALEAMLLKRPMVVGHKVNRLTWEIARRMVHSPWVSLPNVLAGRQLVPECLQRECNPARLGEEILYWLDHPGQVEQLITEFTRMHQALLPPAETSLADAVWRVLHETA